MIGNLELIIILVVVFLLFGARRLPDIARGIGLMPKAMRQLAVVQFFTWFAMFCMWIYFIPAVATRVFGGVAGTPEYMEGLKWGGKCFGVYNGTACGFAFLLLMLVKRFNATERVTVELKTTMQNAFNHPNFISATAAAPTNFDSATFGLLSSQSGTPRVIHFTLTTRW